MATQHSRLDYHRSPTHLAPLPWPTLLTRPDSKPLIDPLQRLLHVISCSAHQSLTLMTNEGSNSG